MSLADEEGKVAFQQCQYSSKSFGKVMDLLDECWFFRNTLVARKIIASSSSSQEKDQKVVAISSTSAAGLDQREYEYFLSTESDQFSNSQRVSRRGRALLRSPTLAVPPQLKLLEEEEEEGAALTLNSPYRKLRHSMSSLEYGSASNSSSSSCKMPSHKLSSCSSGGERLFKLEEKTERYRAILHYIARQNYYRKTFTQKKWRSLSEIEYMEVQGLRDLGFGQNINNHKRDKDHRDVVNKPPYVTSDMYTCFDSKSGQDMKDQLRFWAKAVASNTRHEF